MVADSWPDVLDDTNARRDWGWRPYYDLNTMTKTMLDKLTLNYDFAGTVEFTKMSVFHS